MSEKRVTTDELEAIAFEEGGRISLGLSEARYTDAGGVHYVSPLPYVFVEPPKPGDEVKAEWARGCGMRHVTQIDCTKHVGDYHVATGVTHVLRVWSR